MENKDVLGQRIKERRTEIGFSAAKLAERLQMSKATIYRYESGEIKDIKMPIIETTAKALYVNPLWLMGLSNDKHAELANYMETYKNLGNLLTDFELFVNNSDRNRFKFKYKDVLLEDKDIVFMKSWLKLARDYFESR